MSGLLHIQARAAERRCLESRAHRRLALTTIVCVAVLGAAEVRAGDPKDAFTQTNLVSDGAVPARTTDPDLKNPWGIAFIPGSPFWIADNGTGVSTLYDGAGNKAQLTVQVPGPKNSPSGFVSAPTGLVWNPTSQFHVPGTSLPSLFIFATEDGTISAWGPNLPSNPTQAVLAVDNSQTSPGAVYKGLAMGTNAKGNFLFATNFRMGRIDVFDTAFAPANDKLDGSFNDPDLPSGFAPFGIRNIDGDLFVTYALQNEEKHDDVAGPGNGFVDIFDTDGHLIRRFASRGHLNSPWGISRASYDFGPFSGDILIGNFRDGRINAFGTQGGFRDQIEDAKGAVITIDGLWSLTFGGAANSDPDTLYFTAGPNQEKNGLFGAITPVSDAKSASAQ